MISENAQPIYIYPDQLIKETWPEWVDKILSNCPPPEFRNNRGFQQRIGSENASDRTRAGESYRIGLLLHKLIAERSGKTGNIPKGWEYVCDDKSVLSKTGYLSYAVGKALSEKPDNPELLTALNVLYLIFALSIGTESSGVSVSTTLIYRRVLQCFRDEIGTNSFDAKYEEYSRWLAGAVFNTLDNATARPKLIQEYINSEKITSLILEKESDKSTYPLNGTTLSDKLAGNMVSIPEINHITRHKAALFWAAPHRGIYANAALVGTGLLDKIIPLDRACLSKSGVSILDSVLRNEGSEEHLLLENLNDLLSKRVETSIIWGGLMEKLSNGVYSALAYLENTVEGVLKPNIFHLHGAPEIPPGSTALIVEINKFGMPIRPDIGASVFIKKSEYKVLKIDDTSPFIKIALEAVSNPSLA